MAIRSLLTILSLLSTSVAIASHGDRDPLKPLTDRLETSKITTKYGPFLVPSKNEDNGMKSFTLINATKPCDECILASMQADLLYPDGRVANANNGMWLHHVLMLNTGRQDTSCPQVYERFFASGNERTVVDLSNGGTRMAGYPIETEDTIWLNVELMNEMEESQEASVTIDWVYTSVISPGLDLVTPIWLDVTGVCGANGSEVRPPDSTTFALDMNPSWKSTVSGDIVFVGNHLHDGGISLNISKNDKSVCNGLAHYGESPGYLETMSMDHSHHHDTIGGMVMEHISSITNCSNIGATKIGDSWSLTAQYNFTAHPTMMEQDGLPAPVMGIALVYVANQKTGRNYP